MTTAKRQIEAETPEEILFCQKVHRLYLEYVDDIGERRAHALLRGMVAAIGIKYLSGKRGRRKDPTGYSSDPAAKKKRRQRRSRIEKWLDSNEPLIPDMLAEGGH